MGPKVQSHEALKVWNTINDLHCLSHNWFCKKVVEEHALLWTNELNFILSPMGHDLACVSKFYLNWVDTHLIKYLNSYYPAHDPCCGGCSARISGTIVIQSGLLRHYGCKRQWPPWRVSNGNAARITRYASKSITVFQESHDERL